MEPRPKVAKIETRNLFLQSQADRMVIGDFLRVQVVRNGWIWDGYVLKTEPTGLRRDEMWSMRGRQVIRMMLWFLPTYEREWLRHQLKWWKQKNENKKTKQKTRTDVCLCEKTGNKNLFPDVRFEMPIKHPAVGYFVWRLGINRVERCFDFNVSAFLQMEKVKIKEVKSCWS